MANIELLMPKMGESVNEATIIKWLKNEGDTIAMDEPVLEIATDKVDSEIPSTAEGVLIKKLFKDGDVVQVGKAVAIIGAAGEVKVSAPVVSAKAEEKKAPVTVEKTHAVSSVTSSPKSNGQGKFFSPLVKNIAKKEGITTEELEAIVGTGAEGRVTKNDILAYIPTKGKKSAVSSSIVSETVSTAMQTIKAPPVTASQGDEIIEMDRMRKLIAEHMVMSKHVSPHVTSFVEADVTNLVRWRDRIKKDFEKREGEKITFTPIFIDAVCKAIKDFPMVNVSVDGTKIIVRNNINIGMAAALPSGNLIVPVIKNADRLNLLGLTKAVNDFAGRARINKLLPDEIQGGTYTISNVGTFGNIMGTPIINQPQVAILALGAIKKKPVVIETPDGDSIAIRHMMFLSHSYDHRVVDGALGGQFVRRVADYLEKFDINTPI
jgi:2-oxoglutarate dehydrogenase E2 component (dihydrolipoamide succinyltransferase)